MSTERRSDEATKRRREFLRAGLGVGVAAGIAGGMSLLVLGRSSEACELRSPCQMCGKFAGCGLERARDARSAGGEP